MSKHNNHKKCIEHPNHIISVQKLSKQNKEKRLKRIELYNLNPKICCFCFKNIIYDKKNSKFCNHSCSASFNNKNHTSKRNFSQQGLINIKNTKILQHQKSKKKYELNKTLCVICKKSLPYNKRTNKSCSKLCFSSIISNTAKNNPLFGGNKNNKSFWYTSSIAGKVYLESSYELIIAQILDNNNIIWSRPKPFKWIDSNNVSHNYFPDFHLLDSNIYLDPKNYYLILKDKDKIERVKQQNNIKVFILNKTQLTLNYINDLINSTN